MALPNPLFSLFDLSGRTAYISGGSSGINLAIARQLGLAGVSVAIQSRSQDKIDTAVTGLKAEGLTACGLAADVRDYEATHAAIASFYKQAGPIDIMIAGAAGNFVAPADQITANGFASVVAIDLLGSFNIFRAAIEFARPEGGAFIAISAPQGSVPFPHQAHVNAAKAGINHLVRSLAVEWGARGIRVNAISPGPIDGTEGMRRLTATPEARARVESLIPLRRYGQGDDIAATVLFLASDAGGYITGQVIACDGGIGLMGAALYAGGAQ